MPHGCRRHPAGFDRSASAGTDARECQPPDQNHFARIGGKELPSGHGDHRGKLADRRDAEYRVAIASPLRWASITKGANRPICSRSNPSIMNAIDQLAGVRQFEKLKYDFPQRRRSQPAIFGFDGGIDCLQTDPWMLPASSARVP